MLVNRTMLITVFTLFITTACVNTQSEAQKMQITNLQNELLQEQETHQQTQSELTHTRTALQASEHKTLELTELLSKAQQEKTQLAKRQQAKIKKIVKLDDKTILGQTEWVYISAAKSNYRARIDTGAATSSINAADIERFERDGQRWVRFNLSHDNSKKKQFVEAKIVRIVRIAQSTNLEDGAERRFVVKLHVRIGDMSNQTEFTLSDRSHMEYDVLIGRTFMQDVALVDVSKEYLHPKYTAE